METLIVTKINEVYMEVDCEGGSCWELQDYFTFTVPGSTFMPSVRNKFWDGKIRLFNPQTKRIYAGLLHHVQKFCEERDYNLVIDPKYTDQEFSLAEAKQHEKRLDLPFEVRDYQLDAFAHAIKKRRALLLSPTASGKSLIIYLISSYIRKKTLIIVPTISLVQQMAGDFKSYGYQGEPHCITAGVEKETKNLLTISTWQSIHKMPKKWFEQFDLVIGDEAHLFKSKSLTSIMTKTVGTEYKYGFTGTLDGTTTHKLVLEGLFGPVEKVTTTNELIKKGTLSEFNVKCLELQYPDEIKKIHSKDKYQDEVDFLVRNEARNRFLKNLGISLQGNTLMLYQFVEKHGKPLHLEIKNAIKNSVDKDRKVFFVSGEVDGKAREDIRGIVEKEDNAIIVASYGTFSTGVNIKRLHNIVFCSPSKSRIRVLQSIGRGLRTGENKETATLFDIADNLAWKSKQNFTLQHFAERIKMYNEEKFDYKIYKVALKE
jgi:superfamily II DNA or RNA helicase